MIGNMLRVAVKTAGTYVLVKSAWTDGKCIVEELSNRRRIDVDYTDKTEDVKVSLDEEPDQPKESPVKGQPAVAEKESAAEVPAKATPVHQKPSASAVKSPPTKAKNSGKSNVPGKPKNKQNNKKV